MTHTYEQVLTYELARELINSHIADCASAIGDEEEKAKPDQARIEQMREKMTVLVIERRQMDMTDDATMRAVVTKYRRIPGEAVLPASQGWVSV